MAQNQVTVVCPPGVWTQLTNADATKMTFQVQTGAVYIRFTTDATTPTEDRGLQYKAVEGELQKSFADLTSLTGGDRAWAKPLSRKAVVVVDTN